MGTISEELRKVIEAEPLSVVPTYAQLETLGYVPEGPEIRRFDVKAINDQIERNISILKPTEKVVATGYIDTEGAHVAIVGRIDEVPFTDLKIPGEFKWTVLHVEKWKGGRESMAGFRWSI